MLLQVVVVIFIVVIIIIIVILVVIVVVVVIVDCIRLLDYQLHKMSDPLSLVRQATITNNPVNYVDGFYVFGPYKIHESTETCFKRLLLFYFYNILLNFI